MSFLLDTNFFITAHRTHYPFDVVPSFWQRVEELAVQGVILSIDKVCTEIERGNDILIGWTENHLPDNFFIDSTQHVDAYAHVAHWAVGMGEHYSAGALNEFLDADEADAWLVAVALKTGHTIVTHEVSNPQMKARIALPEPCNHFGLPFCNTIEMFRQLSIQF